MDPILPDVLEPGLRVVVCGTAAGDQSAAAKAYYAGRGNRFYYIAHQIGLTPYLYKPHEFRSLLEHGIGFTDLAKHTFGSDSSLKPPDFDAAAFQAKIAQYHPRVVAFNGKRSAQIYYGSKSIQYGRQPDPVADAVGFVLPSTSGAARKHWDESPWHDLAAFLEKE